MICRGTGLAAAALLAASYLPLMRAGKFHKVVLLLLLLPLMVQVMWLLLAFGCDCNMGLSPVVRMCVCEYAIGRLTCQACLQVVGAQ